MTTRDIAHSILLPEMQLAATEKSGVKVEDEGAPSPSARSAKSIDDLLQDIRSQAQEIFSQVSSGAGARDGQAGKRAGAEKIAKANIDSLFECGFFVGAWLRMRSPLGAQPFCLRAVLDMSDTASDSVFDSRGIPKIRDDGSPVPEKDPQKGKSGRGPVQSGVILGSYDCSSGVVWNFSPIEGRPRCALLSCADLRDSETFEEGQLYITETLDLTEEKSHAAIWELEEAAPFHGGPRDVSIALRLLGTTDFLCSDTTSETISLVPSDKMNNRDSGDWLYNIAWECTPDVDPEGDDATKTDLDLRFLNLDD